MIYLDEINATEKSARNRKWYRFKLMRSGKKGGSALSYRMSVGYIDWN